MRELLAHAARLGVSVHVAHLPEPYRGWYDVDSARVLYDFDLTPIEQQCVLAHELGHVHHGHECEDNPMHERKADIYAARLLIHPAEYAELERVNPDQHHLADELGVTVDLVRVYETHCLTRLRGVTYARSRLGVGQWSFRSAHA